MIVSSKCPRAFDLHDLLAVQLLEFGGGTADPEKKQVDARRLLSLGSCYLPKARQEPGGQEGQAWAGSTQVPQLAVAAAPHRLWLSLSL